jgi:hypothetical protein
MAKKSKSREDASVLGEYARIIGELDGEHETKSEDMTEDQDQCEGNEDQQPQGQEPSSEGETS